MNDEINPPNEVEPASTASFSVARVALWGGIAIIGFLLLSLSIFFFVTRFIPDLIGVSSPLDDMDDGPSLLLPTTMAEAVIAPVDPTALPAVTVTPSPTPFLPLAQISISAADMMTDRVPLNQELELEISVANEAGISNIQLLDNGQTVLSLSYGGDQRIDERQQWVPLSDGWHTLSLLVQDRNGSREEMATLRLRVIDEPFLTENRPIFERANRYMNEIRGLSLKEPVFPYLMGEGELKTVMRDQGYTPEAARIDTLVLSAFDFVEPSYDLYEASIQYAGSSIAGFYDPNSKDFVLVSVDRELNALEELIYAHELMHALQDQHFDLGLLSAGEGDVDFEARLALRALAEGEARLIEELYLEGDYFSEEQRVELFNVYQALYRPRQFTLDPVPVLVAQFNFPYENGLEFVRTIYDQSGWEGVDRLWADPPLSTEQILHPDRYLQGDRPQAIGIEPLDSVLDPAWELIRDDVMGEFYLRQFLGQQLDAAAVDIAALGWGGDRYHVYAQAGQNETLLVWRITWDSSDDAIQFGQAYIRYASAAYGGEQLELIPGASCRQSQPVVCAYPVGPDWIIVRAPDAALAQLALETQLLSDDQ